jgi:5'-methylthioadenosine phosphorylase
MRDIWRTGSMKIGIIGGSGVYDLEGLKRVSHKQIRTPFGQPSAEFICGYLNGVNVYFLPRHGKGHTILPSEINHKANIYAFKTLGVERIVSVSAVGSLKQKLRPRDIVLPDQYVDRTKKSLEHTFFGNGIVAHVSFAEPTCAHLRGMIAASARRVIAGHAGHSGTRVTNGGIYVNMEGPAFSTKAESHAYRKMGFDIIGMTSLAEAKLCREAGICYQAMAMVTDYDCWHETEKSVTLEMIIGNLQANTRLAKEILRDLIPKIPEGRKCGCATAIQNAIVTRRDAVPKKTLKALGPIVSKYM